MITGRPPSPRTSARGWSRRATAVSAATHCRSHTAPVLVLLTLLCTSSTPAAAALAAPVANYQITAVYDAASHTITARQRLTWHNRSTEAATDLWLHLYLNAFANNRSSFARQRRDDWQEWAERYPNGWGYTEVSSVRLGPTDLTARLQFVHPDDDNVDDRTVVRVLLPQPVPPGGTIAIDVDFVSRLPRILSRSGHAGPFALVAQWFPKVGVYRDGAWRCHQYHGTTEFFADFGAYDVSLTVPANGVVGATGTLVDERVNQDGTQTLRFRAEDVHDFAWTIDPRFRVVQESVDGTLVRLLLQPTHLHQAERHLAAVRAALRYYRTHLGAYPYLTLTVVDPGPGASGAGGMEYPTLITVGTAWWIPARLRLPEVIIIHEVGHQYWYGMVANNEAAEAWLDEGVNSYFEARIMEAAYGPAAYLDLFGLRLDGWTLQRLGYLRSPQRDPLTRPGWQFIDADSYAAISYDKAALVLRSLDRRLGGDRLQTALAGYLSAWRFKHPERDDLLESIQSSVGEDLRWYFDQVVADTDLLDYAVTSVESSKIGTFAGHSLRDGRAGTEDAPADGGKARYRNEVIVERLGSVRVPVEVEVRFDDGSAVHERWDGQDRWQRFEYTGEQRVDAAVVDPDHTTPLDANLLNNSRRRTPGAAGIARLAGRWGFWFQNLLWALTGL